MCFMANAYVANEISCGIYQGLQKDYHNRYFTSIKAQPKCMCFFDFDKKIGVLVG